MDGRGDGGGRNGETGAVLTVTRLSTLVLFGAVVCDEKNGHDCSVQTNGLGEDENEHHGHVHTKLLRVAANTNVTSYTDGKACCESTHAHSQAGTEVREAGKKVVVIANC